MEFVLIAYDGTDEKALERRMKVREEHLAGARCLKEEGKILYGGAILDDSDKMIGSVIIYDFPSREELDACLTKDPYVTGNVWQKMQIHKYKTPPKVASAPSVKSHC